MTDPIPAQPSPQPRLVGRIPYYILLGGFLLSLAVTGFYMVTGNDAMVLAIVIVGFFGLLLTVLPPLQFLLYFWRQNPPEVPRLVRRSIYACSGSLIVIGGMYAWVWLAAEEQSLGAAALGIAGVAFGIATMVLLVRFTKRAPVPPGAQLAYTRFSGVGLLFFLIAVIIVPKFACGCGENRYKAAVKSDLRNLVPAEEAFFADSLRYGYNRDLASSFSPMTGVQVEVQFANDKGFRAIGWHNTLPDTRCGVWVGVAPPDGMHGAKESEPRCWKEKPR